MVKVNFILAHTMVSDELQEKLSQEMDLHKLEAYLVLAYEADSMDAFLEGITREPASNQ